MTLLTYVFAYLAVASPAFAVPADVAEDIQAYHNPQESIIRHASVSNSFDELHGLTELQEHEPRLHGRDAITALAATNVTSFTPYTYYASAAYCQPDTTLAWDCGSNCNQNPGFKPIASGGDGVITQFWYVGYDLSKDTIIVAHQGTAFRKIIPAVTDANIVLVPLNSNLFPGVPSNVRVHYGFSIAHALAAIPVLDAVRIGLATYPTTSVTTVGHSLGGALALLYGIFLPLHLPSSTTFKTFTYGQPRVANDAFATFVDSPASRVQLARVTNREDPVPILPPRLVGFTHSSGEVHIDDPTGVWYSCSGQDNSDAMCSVGDATSILDTDIADHSGPYGPVMMGCN